MIHRSLSRQRDLNGRFLKLSTPLSMEEAKLRNLEYQKRYREKYANELRISKAKWKRNNPDKQKEWDKNNIAKVRLIKKKYKKSHPDVILRKGLRARITIALKYQRARKKAGTIKLLGCSVPFLKRYIAKKFKEGMTWENWGFRTWHLDHIKPLSSFDLSDLEQQEIAFHYTNLQPLWARDNLIKGSKIYV